MLAEFASSISHSEIIATPTAPVVMEESPVGFLQSLYSENSDLGYGTPETYIDEMGTEVCPLTEVSCQAIFLNA
jgi:hypothetical protein